MIPFDEALKTRKILLFDGAMGTQLAERGGVTGPMSNFQCPEIVKEVHLAYKAAGSDILLANTFSGNRISLEHAGMIDKIKDINTLGVQICRDAAGDECYVCGDMGPTGKFMEPLGEYTEQQFYDCFAEQATLLKEAGVDLIAIETMTDVKEAAVAVRAVKEATGLFVVASISYDPVGDSFRTMMGDTPEKAARELAEAGADAIGSNCGTIDPEEMSRLIAELRQYTDIVLVAEPNAGKPELSAGQVSFKLSPEGYADGAMKCVENGAALVGGCCGTTPAHIAALAKRVK